MLCLAPKVEMPRSTACFFDVSPVVKQVECSHLSYQSSPKPLSPSVHHGYCTANINKQHQTPKATKKIDTQQEHPDMGKNNLIRGGKHHCPNKTTGKTHVFSNRCIKKDHGRWCPTCRQIVSTFFSCSRCGRKNEELLKVTMKEIEK